MHRKGQGFPRAITSLQAALCGNDHGHDCRDFSAREGASENLVRWNSCLLRSLQGHGLRWVLDGARVGNDADLCLINAACPMPHQCPGARRACNGPWSDSGVRRARIGRRSTILPKLLLPTLYYQQSHANAHCSANQNMTTRMRARNHAPCKSRAATSLLL